MFQLYLQFLSRSDYEDPEVELRSSEGPALAVPRSAVVQDGLTHVLFRRDEKDPDTVVGFHKREIDALDPSMQNAPVRCEATLDAVVTHVD